MGTQRAAFGPLSFFTGLQSGLAGGRLGGHTWDEVRST
jgi:hypothetical protein